MNEEADTAGGAGLLATTSLRPRYLVVGLALAILLSGLYFARRSGADYQTYSNDFNVYYFAAREVLAGRDPYQHSLGPWTPYLYPPVLSELIIPLALLPLPAAAYIWFLISAASSLASAWMSAWLAGKEDTEGKGHSEDSTPLRVLIAAGALVIVARFTLDNLDLGQVNLVVTALAVAHVYLYANGRKAASAAALALAVSIKLTPALLIFYHLARRRLKYAAACAALFAAMMATSFLPFGAGAPIAFQAFVERTVKNEQGFDLKYSGNQSLRGVAARLAGASGETAGEPATALTSATTLILSAAMLALSLYIAAVARSEAWAAAPFFCSIVLVSPLSWKAHFVTLLLPAALLLRQMARARGIRIYRIGVALVAAFILFNLTSPKVIGLRASEWADEHSLVFFGGLIVFLAVAVEISAYHRRPDRI